MTILSVKDLGKSYKYYRSEIHRILNWFGFNLQPASESWILKHISFDIKKGESIGIVGKNGAGKSTLLKMVTGTLQPTEGCVTVNGKISAILELGMGFNADLTARQNVMHALGLQGHSYQDILSKMPEIEEFAEIGTYFDEPLRTYSSGMQMRVAFAVATAFRPDILIVDEALSVGDAYFQAKCYDRIAQFRTLGMSLILVTHSTADVVKHCDRAILIHEGRVKSDGDPKDITNNYLSLLQTNTRRQKNQEIEHDSLSLDNEDHFHERPLYRKEEHRFGNGGGKITDFLVRTESGDYPSLIYSGEYVDFYFSAHTDLDYSDVVPGILIKTIDGLFLYGANSFCLNHGYCSLTKGKNTTFHFRIPLALNTGHYLISFGLSHGQVDSLNPIDRRYDSVLVYVENQDSFWGICDLHAKFNQE